MAALVVSNVLIALVAGYLGWLLRDSIRSARAREDELLTWVKDTPTAVVQASPKVVMPDPIYVDEEEEEDDAAA